jgi:2-dehydro-3-deoxyphosphogluconate aldolase/(4S)-4-hydroxy-2-oxoglutarate aldolase
MKHLHTQLKQHRLVPVIAIDSADDALPLSEALAAGGLPVAEITFRTDAAEESIKKIAKSGNVLVGAGTVLNIDTAKRAIDAGASFLVTPGFSHKIVEFCLSRHMPIIPGTGSATDLQAAAEFGLSVVKFFPAEAIGGLKLLKALAAPFGVIKFMPTGGISADNVCAYLAFPAVLACGGSWMVARETIAAKQFDTIRSLTAQAVSLVKAAQTEK